MRVNPSVAHGLTLIALALVAAQMRVVTVEGIGTLCVVLLTAIGNHLADPNTGRLRDADYQDCLCVRDACPVHRPRRSRSEASTPPGPTSGA